MKRFVIFSVILCIGFLFSCKQANNNKNGDSTVKIFAAAGTMLPTNAICNEYEKQFNIKIDRNFAASGALARQIEAGADADIFISANKQWIDFLVENNLLIQNNISDLAKNNLVVICSKDRDIKIEFVNNFDIKSSVKERIAIGDTKYVPVGKYAKQVLDTLGWYGKIENQIILAKDVTSVLHYVELGECDWGIVYYSEAIKSDKVKIAYEIPNDLYNPIIFYIGLLNENQKSKKLYWYFKSDEMQEIFKKYGFITN